MSLDTIHTSFEDFPGLLRSKTSGKGAADRLIEKSVCICRSRDHRPDRIKDGVESYSIEIRRQPEVLPNAILATIAERPEFKEN